MKKKNGSYLNPVLCLSLFATTFSCLASLTVVGDLGGEPARPYFDAINAGPDSPVPDMSSLPQPPASLSISDMLPVSTPEMTPGAVISRPLQLPGLPPVFVVGDDDMSRAWLQQRGAELKRMGATGMVVNVRTERALNSLRQLLPDTEMVPVRGGDLAQRLKLTHYPVLITADGLAQ
ncbi:integrating conjugative element protein [Enterobacter ludwigii]|uniref:integrating conjugative element protein n=1 Tax=Enterobacter ludwigii TaxID=299767 RepID=UPI00111A4B15|nr:integrating conjugative element protein [Enterobacter ludwigii]TNL02018.1 integrating conjugative element protein [Kosakonia cowanii]WGC20693.1 integrating conjugative element protein [Enterobacter ludwigii]